MKIIFTHIPKTAGSSFTKDVLCTNVKNEKFFKYNKGFLNSLGKIYKNNPEIIHGHLAFGLHRYIPGTWEYITFFRDPIQRAISHYYFILQSKYPNYEHPQYYVCKTTSLEDIYNKGKLLNNLQTRFICGTGYNSQKCTSSMLRVAKKNLEKHYAVFGIQEHYNDSVKLIASFFNFNLPSESTVTREQKTIKKPDIDQATIKALKACHSYDLELYQFAKEKFFKMIDDQKVLSVLK